MTDEDLFDLVRASAATFQDAYDALGRAVYVDRTMTFEEGKERARKLAQNYLDDVARAIIQAIVTKAVAKAVTEGFATGGVVRTPPRHVFREQCRHEFRESDFQEPPA